MWLMVVVLRCGGGGRLFILLHLVMISSLYLGGHLFMISGLYLQGGTCS